MLGLASAMPAQAAVTEQVQASQQVGFELFLPLRNVAQLDQLLEAQQTSGTAEYQQWLTPQQFHERFGPTDAQVARVTASLAAAGLTVTATHTRSLHIEGSAATVQKLFGTRLVYKANGVGGKRLAAEGGVVLPAALAQEGAVVAHFSPSVHLRSHARSIALGAKDLETPANRYAASGPYWYNDLKQAYDYPSFQAKAPLTGKQLNGQGVNVGIVMASDVLDSDIKAVFDHEHWTTTTGTPDPVLAGRVAINGGAPFSTSNGASFEASLDVQQVLGGATGSSVTLFNTPDLSDEQILDAYLTIVEANKMDVVSSSFGGCELFYTAAYNNGVDQIGVLDVYDELFKQGNAQGITFVASSGDSGGLGCPDVNYLSGLPSKFVAGVEQPASSPHVTAVGGTNLITTAPPSPQTNPPTLTSKYVAENAFGDPELPYDPYGLGSNVSGGYWGAGGGISVHFARPLYQSLVRGFEEVRSRMRTVPDLGMQVGGCPAGIVASTCGADGTRSAVVISFGGSFDGVIGTSVAAPEFAGVVALGVQRFGHRLGNLNTYIYNTAFVQHYLGKSSAPFRFYHQNIPGFDGLYNADPTKQAYNFMTGNGTPDVRNFLALPNVAPAGDPQTISNP
ncbi:serine protease [Aliidongia dinghuensis]|uniref:Serine protease n=1 Tax=Aliidongia dinghuensis TaxID=1867774 RepID=A0A8J2YVC0_9PROT|nr:protease pro-enzyme activation domain-containing protein [Aliidongia dinghuensis]GGF27599.1 serine protease [Aliidongia dinghuensis]